MDSGKEIIREQFKTLKVVDGKEYVELEEALRVIPGSTDFQEAFKTMRNLLTSINTNLANIPKTVGELENKVSEVSTID